MEEMEGNGEFDQGGEEVFVMCENEGVKRGIYREREREWPNGIGWVWEGKVFEFESEVGGVLGKSVVGW